MHGSCQHEPPLCHAELIIDPAQRSYEYQYNKKIRFTLQLDSDQPLQYRKGSDGDLVSTPFHQQAFFSSPVEQWATVCISLSRNARVMKPGRAVEKVILGQSGQPLIYGVNGVYDQDHDLLIAWYERPFEWLSDRFQINDDGAIAYFRVLLGPEPWIVHWQMQYYRQHLGFSHYRPWVYQPNPESIAGWCSWEAYHKNVSLEKVSEAVSMLKDKLQPYGLLYIQIDDGYQKPVQPFKEDGTLAESFIHTNEQFPGGHAALVQTIASRGFKPGIWSNVSVNNPLFAKKSPYIFKDADGDPIICDWLTYCLDMTPSCQKLHIEPLYSAFRDYGYKYVKVDSLRHLLFDGLRPIAASGQISLYEADRRFCDLISMIRNTLGDDCYLLVCWGVLSEAIGKADACRIATDANPSWKAIRMQLFETARWYFAQRILFTIDPDHICVRTNLEWAQSVLSLTSLSGCLMMLSDDPNLYDEKRIDLIKKTLPPLMSTTAETGPLDFAMPAWASDLMDKKELFSETLFGSLWCWHLRSNSQAWVVALRVGIEPQLPLRCTLEALGLDPAKTYFAFDFWQGKYLGLITEALNFHALDLGACQVVAIRQLDHRPQFVASDRHVSMDMVGVKDEIWQESTQILQLLLVGVPGDKNTYWIRIPEGWEMSRIDSKTAIIEEAVVYDAPNQDEKDHILKVSICFLDREDRLDFHFL
ncbi:MAG: alpha-galactosidase [Clostridia bacterium]|nr:alpha-galactosidase [Clostridia bacterium]